MSKILFLDTETGGLDDTKHALLTIGYTITNNLYQAIMSKEFKVPINGEVTQQALDVNGLDVTNWIPDMTVAEVVNQIKKDMGECLETPSLYGHNIFFDLGFIKAQDKDAYLSLSGIFKRNVVDTKSLLIHAINEGKYDGSASMHKFVGIEPGHHDAKEDTLINTELVKKFNIINNK